MDKELEWTFLQRWYRNGRRAYAKRLDITNYYQQNKMTSWWVCGESGIPVHHLWDYKMVQPHWKTVRQFLPGINRVTTWSSSSTGRYIPRRNENLPTNTYTCTNTRWMFIPALFIISKKRNNSNYHQKRSG